MLSFDMGGTTAKLCLIPNGEPTVGTDLEVAHYQRFRKGRGFPLKIQSIQHDRDRRRRRLASRRRTRLACSMSGRARRGALPGPAAYQRGGTEPTVTDADILLGYMGDELLCRRLVQGARRTPRQAAMAKLAASLGRQRRRAAPGASTISSTNA